MPRKGKLGKNPSTGGSRKGSNEKLKEAALTDEQNKRKSLLKGGSGPGEAAKKSLLNDLGGLIFMCSSSTKADCFKYRVFGLNEGKRNLVEQVRKGMRLFLFDIELRLLYGIYVAASNGSYNLERDAFGGAFRCQVRFTIQKDCLPLPEDVFQAAIKDNYFENGKFKVELTTEQVHKLVKLFRPLPVNLSRSPLRPGMAPVERPGKAEAHRYSDSDQYLRDGFVPGRFSPRTKYETGNVSFNPGRHQLMSKYETSSNPGRLSPISKYELSSLPGRLAPITRYDSNYMESDGYRAERQAPGYSQSFSKYSQYRIPEERKIGDGRVLDDPYSGRELRLQQELTQHSHVGIGSRIPAQLSLPTYSADPLHFLSDLRQPRARDDLYSLYSQASVLNADEDSLYRHRPLVPDVRADAPYRRVTGLDPLVESSLAHPSGLTGDFLHTGLSTDVYPSSTRYGRLEKFESGTGPLSGGISGASVLANRGNGLPHTRYY